MGEVTSIGGLTGVFFVLFFSVFFVNLLIAQCEVHEEHEENATKNTRRFRIPKFTPSKYSSTSETEMNQF